jgi:MYXO-CTERM domain-containing protein
MTDPTGVSHSPEEMERVISQQREELAKTVDALQAKFDVKSLVQHKAENLRQHPEWLGAAALAMVAVVALVVWRRRR